MSVYYRPVHKDGTHLADSNHTDGAYRGNLLDDVTNKPIGNAEWVKVDDSELEEQYAYPVEAPRQEVKLTPEQKVLVDMVGTAIAAGLTWFAIEVVAPEVKHLWHKKASPAISVKWESIKEHHKQQKAKEKTVVRPAQITKVLSAPAENMLGMVVQELDDAYDNYVQDMTSQEAQKELLDIFLFSAMLAAKVRKLKNSRIVDGEAPNGYIEAQQLINRLASPEFTQSINQIFKCNPTLLEEKATSLSDIFGWSLYAEGQYVSIERGQLREKLMAD
jgi:hypothetical protein